ncbi:hypothetical protein ACFQLX_14980 [Streptomyces polyrhachis]|uniref:Ribbon-helix-helix protein CopG domain-containing protein n=1 Tax=Streptomyces polyrhachis TaxID=1282885 RepID=A0ABW2GJ51_9ACTN
MSKSVTIRVPDDVYAELKGRADAEGTTVTELITSAALRDTRLNLPTPHADRFLAGAHEAFTEAFPDPSRSDPSHGDSYRSGRAA